MILWFCIKPRPQTFNTMADFDVDNPAFEPNDWEEDIGGDDVLSTSLHDDMSSEGATIQTSSLQQELLHSWRPILTSIWSTKGRAPPPPSPPPPPLPPMPSQPLPTSLGGSCDLRGAGVCVLGAEKVKSQACPLRQLNPSKPKIGSWERPQPL